MVLIYKYRHQFLSDIVINEYIISIKANTNQNQAKNKQKYHYAQKWNHVSNAALRKILPPPPEMEKNPSDLQKRV